MVEAICKRQLSHVIANENAKMSAFSFHGLDIVHVRL